MPNTALHPIASTYQTLTVDNTAGGVALTVPASAHHVLITNLATGQNVRFTDDGTIVTASVGQPLYPGDIMDLTDTERNYRDEIIALKFIREGGTNSTLTISYYE